MSRALRTAALAACLAGCTSLAGLEDLSFQAAGGAGGTATGGSGGSTSSGGGSTPSGGGGTGGTTPTGGGAGGGTEACHPQDLVDDFSDGSLNTVLWSPWSNNGATVGEEAGVAWMAPGPNQSAISFSDIHTNHLYDIRDCSTWVEAAQVLDPAVPGQAFMDVQQDGDNKIHIQASEGELRIQLWTSGVMTDEPVSIYSATNHRWWRVREAAGTLYAETSPDSATWTVQFSKETPTWFTEVHITIGAGTWAAVASPGRAEFDNVNVTP